MLKKVHISNFRSIENAEIDLGSINVLFGPTSAGKSTLFYSLLVLRNFVVNPNQIADGLFNIGFMNLGGFNACVFNHSELDSIGIEAEFDKFESQTKYGINIKKNDVKIKTSIDSFEMDEQVSIPYPANQSFSYDSDDLNNFTINWNGFSGSVVPAVSDEESMGIARLFATKINTPVESLKRIDICQHSRGFFKPSYSPIPLTLTPTSEDEVATLIITDQNMPPRISIDTMEIFDRDFRTFTPPGTATTFLQTTEQSGAKVPGYLVNDGFGVNQVVFMLAKIHRQDSETILIEEPEVHLHPSVIRKFARVLANLVKDEKKQLLFTTHSSQFLLSLLACVQEGILSPDDLCCYYVKREKKKSIFSRADVNNNGQISGGLSSFMDAELEDIKSFLSIKK
jgi:predicted ATPase